MFDPGFAAGLTAELDHAPHLGDLSQELVVAGLGGRLRPPCQEHGCRSVLGPQHQPEMVGEERHHRPDHAQRCHERVPERLERRLFAVPEAPP